MCDCASNMNEMLVEKNTRLACAFRIVRGHLVAIPTLLSTEKINRYGPQKLPLVVPTFCPFCGVKYDIGETEPDLTIAES
jgi:hypothetical protein